MTFELAAIVPRWAFDTLPEGAEIVDAGGDLLAVHSASAPFASLAKSRRAVARRALKRQQLLESLMPAGAVLPVAPGTRLDRDAVMALLAADQDRLREHVRALTGRWQFQVVLEWAEADVLSHFGGTPELAPALSQAQAGGAIAGGVLADAVGRLAARLGATALETLARCAEDVIEFPRDGAMLLNAALLVPHSQEAALDVALHRVDAAWPDGFRLRLLGPSPAASFAMLTLTEVTADALASACRLLGLPQDAPAQDLVKARRTLLRAGLARPEEVTQAVEDLACWQRFGRRAPAFRIAARRDGMAGSQPLAEVA